MNDRRMEDRAAIAARESIVKCGYATRGELESWNVSSVLDSSRSYYTIEFRNANSSRVVEVVVHARVKPCKSGGESMSVEITKVIEGHQNLLTRPVVGNVLFRRMDTSACAA